MRKSKKEVLTSTKENEQTAVGTSWAPYLLDTRHLRLGHPIKYHGDFRKKHVCEGYSKLGNAGKGTGRRQSLRHGAISSRHDCRRNFTMQEQNVRIRFRPAALDFWCTNGPGGLADNTSISLFFSVDHSPSELPCM